MSLGWFKKWTIERTTKEIIKGIVQKVDATLRINPGLTLEEALRLVDKNRGIFFPDEESSTTDLQSLFLMMVWKGYRYERVSDRDSANKEHLELVIGIANDYLSMILSKTKDDYEKLATEYNNRGNDYSKLAQYERAIENYNKAILLKPDLAIAYNNRGIAYSNLGQKERAIEDYNEAIRLQPNLATAYTNRGAAYNGLGQHQRAIEDYNEVVRLQPSFTDVYNLRGNSYAYLDQYELAIKDYNKAIQLKPDFAASYSNRGRAYFKLGDNDLGCSDAKKACALGECKLLEDIKDKGLCR